jgi:hypothetical protein
MPLSACSLQALSMLCTQSSPQQQLALALQVRRKPGAMPATSSTAAEVDRETIQRRLQQHLKSRCPICPQKRASHTIQCSCFRPECVMFQSGCFMLSSLIPPFMQGDEGSSQQGRALMHIKLPSIRTRLKQRPGKRKPAAATSVAQLPWMQDWIVTGASLAVTTTCKLTANE